MAWAEFTDDHDQPVAPGQLIAFRPGMRVPVKRAWLELAVAMGRAREIRAPRREHRDQLAVDPYWRPEG